MLKNLEGKLRELGGVMSALAAEFRAESEAFAELDLFCAPAECGDVVHEASLKRRAKIAAEWGWDLLALERELAARVDRYWLYKNGLLSLM